MGACLSLPILKSYDIDGKEQNSAWVRYLLDAVAGNWLLGVSCGRLVEIAGIDSFSGEPELQNVHLFRPVKNPAREKDFCHHADASERYAQDHCHHHEIGRASCRERV